MLAGSMQSMKKLTLLNARVTKLRYYNGASSITEVEVEVSTGFDDSTVVPGLEVALFWGAKILQSAKTDEYGLAILYHKGIDLDPVKTSNHLHYKFNSDSRQLRVRVKGFGLTVEVPWPSVEFKDCDTYIF